MSAADVEVWHVVDYDGRPLPGTWPTEAEAVDNGLCGKYLLTGAEVRPGEPDEALS